MEQENNYKTTKMDSHERLRNLYFQPGDVIAGRYEFVRELGRGGMGCVFLCRDMRADNREMALKTVPDILRNNTEAVAELKQEYNTMYELTHDGIVAVRNLVDDVFRYYVVMDYADGETLESYLKNHPKPGLAVTQEVVRRLAAALDYAHGKGLIHRDVKPANVMVQIDGEKVKSVKLLDFGLGRCIRESFSRTTGQWMTGGTPAYKSPEQWNPAAFGNPTAKSDQYSLGALAYEMLNGTYPFAGCDFETLGYSVLHTAPSTIVGVSEAVNAALQMALVKKPDDRFENCVAFAKALEGRAAADISVVEAAPPQAANQTPSSPAAASAEKKDNLTFKLADGVDLEMIWIPAGTFMMGSPEDELGRYDNETQHQVTLTQGFWIGKYPVTQAQYKGVTGGNPSHFTSFFGGMKKDNPVESVSWDEIGHFCYVLNETHESELPSGYKFALPTEAQWEYACRAGTTRALNSNQNLLNGNGYDSRLDELGWYDANSGGKTHPVGQKKPNAWGLYDMHGNVWEWCRDNCKYAGGVATDTYRDGVVDPVCCSGSNRVLRGGSWRNFAGYCRSASRHDRDPSISRNYVGFRLALAPVQ